MFTYPSIEITFNFVFFFLNKHKTHMHYTFTKTIISYFQIKTDYDRGMTFKSESTPKLAYIKLYTCVTIILVL